MVYPVDAANSSHDPPSSVKASGAHTLPTPCAAGYPPLRSPYPRMGKELPCEVLHITQYLDRLVSEGRLRLRHSVPLLLTYHDPCHLGRMGEPFLSDWPGDKLERPMSLKRAGRKGVYEEPRRLLRALPGADLCEMERIREYAWCCGAGGGVMEAFPDFASWTAAERLEEALASGAEALATACPWCVRAFRDAASEAGIDLPVYDLIDLAVMAAGVSVPAAT